MTKLFYFWCSNWPEKCSFFLFYSSSLRFVRRFAASGFFFLGLFNVLDTSNFTANIFYCFPCPFADWHSFVGRSETMGIGCLLAMAEKLKFGALMTKWNSSFGRMNFDARTAVSRGVDRDQSVPLCFRNGGWHRSRSRPAGEGGRGVYGDPPWGESSRIKYFEFQKGKIFKGNENWKLMSSWRHIAKRNYLYDAPPLAPPLKGVRIPTYKL